MNGWWLRWLGVDAARLPAGATTEFVWTHAPRSWGVFVLLAALAAVVYAVLWLYRREIPSCPRPVRIGLGLLRAAVLVLLALVFLGPALAVAQRRTVQPYILVLVDDSLSMSIADRYAEEPALARVAAATGQNAGSLRTKPLTRAQVVEDLFNTAGGKLLRDLSTRGQVKLFTFSNKLKPRETLAAAKPRDEASAPNPGGPATQPVAPDIETDNAPFHLDPAGPSTNLAKAVREALHSVQGSPVAAIVLFTDGQNTDGDGPLSAAEAASAQGVPVFAVGIGDPAKPRDVRVADVWARDHVWKEDPFQVEATIAAEGYGDLTLPVELIEHQVAADPGAPGSEATTQPGSTGASARDTVVGRKTVSLSAAKPQETVNFTYAPRQAGRFIYTVRVEPQPNELLASNNEGHVTVTVLSSEARVLLIAGAPSWEYQLVRDLLLRDKSINLSCWLQSMDLDMRQEGKTIIDKLPEKPEDLFKYDAVLMFDPNPSPIYNPLELGDNFLTMLKQFLDQAGGFGYLAGPQFSTRFLTLPPTSGYREVLPVMLGEMDQAEAETLLAVYSRQWPLRLTADGVDHPILRLDADPQVSRGKWELMPGIFWSFPARSAKPAARTLLEHSDPALRHREQGRPLLVAGQYGPGRTVYIGFDGTWRWRAVGRDSEYFDKFWIQTVRYLIEGRRVGGRRGLVSTEAELYPLGATVAVSATLYDAAIQPLAQPVVPATLRGGRGPGVEFELKPVEGRPGHYEASVLATQLGANEITVTLPGPRESDTVRLTRQFTVEVPRVEFADPRLNKQALVDLARRTTGSYFEVDEVGRLAPSVPDRRETIVIRGKPVELWDTSRVLALLVLLLTVEWAVRKAYKLM